MPDMLLDQEALGLVDGSFDGLKLLDKLLAILPVLHHGQDASQMTTCLPQTFLDFGIMMRHIPLSPRGEGHVKIQSLRLFPSAEGFTGHSRLSVFFVIRFAPDPEHF